MIELKNEFLMPPIKTGFCTKEGFVTDKFIDYYRRRAEYIGAITFEPFFIDKNAKELPTQVGIDDDDKLEGLKKLNSKIHEYDTKTIAHINHPGRMANPMIPTNRWLSSSDIACENGGAQPKAMDENDIEEVIKIFTDASVRAEKAGFDIVELQFGHGYLLAQFLSPLVNKRTDEYGGSFENRVKFPLKVIDTVQKSVNLPIIARISGEEMVPGGLKIDEMIELSKNLESKGVEAIHVSAGTICSTPPWFFQHMYVPKGKTWEYASQIQKNVGIPVIYVGKINTFEDIELLKTKYGAKYLAVGRALLADPDFIGKYSGKIKENYRPCSACAEGCLGGVKSGNGLGCVVNPLVGNDFDTIEKAVTAKNIAVVGGGLAGMEAAISLKKKGHNVDLFEKEKLGGQFNLAHLPPKKDSLKNILTYYFDEIKRAEVNVIEKEADKQILTGGKYDTVVLATGSLPAIPPIEGLKDYFWAEMLEEHNLPEGQKVIVIGGGLIGLEIAHALVHKNNQVIIVEMLGDLARDMEMIERKLTLKTIKEKKTEIYLNTKVTRIDKDTCYLEGETTKEINNIDRVIVATGMKSYNPLQKEIENDVETYVIGDANTPGKAMTAIRDAFYLAQKI